MPFAIFSQNIQISGTVKDKQNRGIESASVVVLDKAQKTLNYTYSAENGMYLLTFNKPNSTMLTFVVSSLGYIQEEIKIDITDKKNVILSFMLAESTEILKEVIIEVNQKIKIDRDTTTIKVASFGNRTEQTVEDILKKIPGIEVQQDGTIKAHGKKIDKLLIEGEDMFDKNYKLLTKNLDANVIDAVQIIDDFEDNPILKKLNNSDKVALNLKFKKGKKNIWFGNVTLGSGIVSENRWKESLNLGLIRKKIKLFYLADYNNLGEKATDVVLANFLESNNFGEDRLEYKAKSLFTINRNEIGLFSKTQSVFNNAFLNALSFNTKIKKNVSVRGVVYQTNDKQNQSSFSETKYNLDANPISFTENNLYSNKKTLASTEIELKYYADEKNYLTNLFVFKDNPATVNSDLIFNDDVINQTSRNKNYTYYNHFNHTYQLTDNKVLNNYLYFGRDKIIEKTNIMSPLLNIFLEINPDDVIRQRAKNNLFFIGGKTKLITKWRDIDITNSILIENNKEIFVNQFSVKEQRFLEYENTSNLNQLKLYFDNIIRYNISKEINVTASLSVQNNIFQTNLDHRNTFLINPAITINLKKTGFGNFIFSFSENSTLPEINQLTSNFQLVNYRSFLQGTTYQNPLKNSITSFNYSIYQDEKRFSINTGLYYIKSKSIFNATSKLTNNFNFSTGLQTSGGENYNFNFSFVNYIRKLKIASKIETIQNWNSTPINVNSDVFLNSKNYSNTIKYTTTTYFKKPINFDGGFAYHYSQSVFYNSKNNNITKDIFLNINYTVSKTLLAECNSAVYFINRQNYSFSNIIFNYNPVESRFSYRLVFNNILNENKFSFITLNNFMFYQSNVELVPRYLLCTVKYRF